MSKSSNFQPNWASTPGDTIADILKEKNVSLPDFAKGMDSSIDNVKGLLHGFVYINDQIALKLASVLGASVNFWVKREAQYRASVERLRAVEEEKWINELPIFDMISLGWIQKSNEIVKSCLDFFNVPDVWAWKNKYGEVVSLTAFRKSASLKSNPSAIAAWLRYGEIKSGEVQCKEWNSVAFSKALSEIRPLTKIKSPNIFLPKLVEICSSCGVVVVISKTPVGCTASGATNFISSDKALILLSFRYMSDDHFWFTFFHEAAHLLLHAHTHLFIEQDVTNEKISKEEIEANEFSSNILIPQNLQSQLRTMDVTEREIKNMAMQANVSLGIVIGQLQHIERLPHKNLNSYKRRYKWDDILS